MEKLDNKENISDLEHHDAARNESDKSSSTNGVAVPALKSEEEKKLVRKIDLYILPCMWMMYLWSYMDRTNIGNAKVAGMADDLELDSNKYSIALVVFFVSYVVFEIPSNMIITRVRPSIYLPLIMAIWGCVTIGMAFSQNAGTLYALRFLMGIFESGFAPGMLMLLSSWYRKEEQSRRFAVYISAAILSGAFGGLLAGAITSGLEGHRGIRGWRWLFIVEGVCSICVAGAATFILPDFPATTSRKKFTEAEQQLAIQRLRQESQNVQTGPKPTLGHFQALKISLTNWRTWLFVVGYMAVVGSSTLSYFYPTLVEGLNYKGKDAQYMTVPIFGVAFFATAITGWVADKNPKWRGLMLGGWMTIAMLCAIITCVVYDYKGRYALLVIMASGLWASNGLSLSYASVSFGHMETEVRAISLAFVNAMGNLAQIYGAYLFPSDDKPKYLMGFGVISGLCFTGVISYLSLHFLLKRQPRA